MILINPKTHYSVVATCSQHNHNKATAPATKAASAPRPSATAIGDGAAPPAELVDFAAVADAVDADVAVEVALTVAGSVAVEVEVAVEVAVAVEVWVVEGSVVNFESEEVVLQF